MLNEGTVGVARFPVGEPEFHLNAHRVDRAVHIPELDALLIERTTILTQPRRLA